ncbi:MAG: hypothetical protein JXA74_07810 [Anaerolineae bacterium]|nr:hypothetical protein [Anaerolineae bacterium]
MAEQMRSDIHAGFSGPPVPSDYVLSSGDMEVLLEGHLDLVEREIRRLLRQLDGAVWPGEEPVRWRQPRQVRTWLRAWTSLNYLIHARDALRDALDPAARHFD